MSILEKRLEWAAGIEWKVWKVEEVTPEQAAQSIQGSVFWNHCYVCGHFIIEHWLLKPITLKGIREFNERKRDTFFRDAPFLIVGNECGPALLEGEELLRAEKESKDLKKQKRYSRNLRKFKPIVDECKRMLTLPNIDQTGESTYYRNDKERLEMVIYKIKVGTFSKDTYWLDRLNWIRKRHNLPEIPFSFYEQCKSSSKIDGFICKKCGNVVEPQYYRRGEKLIESYECCGISYKLTEK